jgi:uncharacterized protein (UPF0262 family)
MSNEPPVQSEEKSDNHLVEVILDEASIARCSPDIEHERNVAIYDLLESNSFELEKSTSKGPYTLLLALEDNRLVFHVGDKDRKPVKSLMLSLSSFRRLVKDYFLLCDSYFEAIKTAPPSRIEAIDMGRRGLHNEGAQLVHDRLNGKIKVDFETSRRLFTLICALQWPGGPVR